ncbi:YpdA family putative bacillithiol disulfide reductase [Pontibacter sp. G13]|uniref:YpdA family putative bacillithiol disulfide reductase n=1 Tax=Pontibacter sp. G13 TaxID=3074898 RepID=UPI00288A4E40|nr:YpdA family putative bacillithiol disulfide reductase [Pontibacter sp. G13]WNJ16597.1 YpdA family putative bacillithiol disulfide reductase [Pontibacter sp. G13]
MLDVLIIGAGPIGLACGIEAKRRNLSYVIVEKGCLVNSIYHYPANMTFFSTSEKIEIGGVPFVSHGPKPTRAEALEYYRRVAQLYDLTIHNYEMVQEVLPDGDFYKIHSSKQTYQARAVVVATGFYDHPNLMGVPGEDLPKVSHYYTEPHPYIGQRVLVVGAANSAVDVALETWRKGAEVTLVHRGPEIGRRVKYWVKPDIENRIKEGSIQAFFESHITEIRPHEVDLMTPDGRITIGNDFVMAMTGYQPDYSWLNNMGICISSDDLKLPQRNEETFETNLPNVYLAGTVCGGMQTNKWFIENSIEHANVVMDEIHKRKELASA